MPIFKNGGLGGSLEVPKFVRIDTDQFFSTVDQNPSGLGETNKIQVEFGAGGTTAGGDVTVSVLGEITFNSAGNYELMVDASIGRTATSNVVNLIGWFEVATDGSIFSQVGFTFSVEIDDQNTIWARSFSLDEVTLPAGAKARLYVARDESATDNGGLLTRQPTATLASLNPAVSSRIRFKKEQLVSVG